MLDLFSPMRMMTWVAVMPRLCDRERSAARRLSLRHAALRRSRRTTEDYAQLVPDLMFEVKSKTDSLPKLRQKIQEFLALGTQVGV